MLDFTGVKCPVCEVPFKKNDDIVVCPSCGAPYHRGCYHDAGRCVFEEELHGSGKSWAAPAPPEPPDMTSEIKDQECPSCGILNAHSALFCNRCGVSLRPQQQQYQNRQSNNTETSPPQKKPIPPGFFGGTAFSPFQFDPMGGVSPTEELDDKVSFGDASKLVKQNTSYYMPVFRRIKTTKKNKFNFSAFICSGPWMLYRKQYKAGAVVTALIFALYLTSTFLSMFLSSPILFGVMEQVGVDISSYPSMSATQLQQVISILMENPADYLKAISPLICMAGILIIMIVIGIRGNKMYMKHCIKTAKKIKNNSSITNVNDEINSHGGVNTGIAICMFVCYAIVSNISFFIT